MSRSEEFRRSGYPAVQRDEVVHIGTLNENDRNSWSLEGDGLSVSDHPDAWRKIAKLGGLPEFSVTHPERPLSFVDAHRVSPSMHQQIETWATENNLGRQVPVWHVDQWDDEYEDTYRSTYTSHEEAMDEASDTAKVTRGRQFSFFDEHAPRGADPSNTQDALLTKWSNDATSADGVWWNDQLDPSRLSAPRGVIVPRQISSLSYRRRTSREP